MSAASAPRAPAARLAQALLPSLVALLSATALSSALVIAVGRAPLEVYAALWSGTWGSAYGAGQVLFKATPLLLSGLAVAVPLRAGLFNVGAEGQMAAGAFAAGLAGMALPASTPSAAALPLALLASLAGGAFVGAVPGALKARRGAHEVITTILLNFIVLALLEDLAKPLYLRETVHLPPIVAGAELPRASALFPSLAGSALSAALPLALLLALAVWAMLGRTVLGFRLAAVGESAPAAALHGTPVGAITVLALALGGGLAGLGGGAFVLGYKHYYEEGLASGVGFMGIAVALLGRGHPAGIAVAAVLFGTLAQGGLAINALVPKELVDVLQAVIILGVAAAGARPRSGR